MTDENDWAAYIDRRIEQRVVAERSATLAAVLGAFEALNLEGLCEAITNARIQGEKEMAAQLRELRTALNDMQAAFHKLAAAEPQGRRPRSARVAVVAPRRELKTSAPPRCEVISAKFVGPLRRCKPVHLTPHSGSGLLSDFATLGIVVRKIAMTKIVCLHITAPDLSG